jgi:hypothetical protein
MKVGALVGKKSDYDPDTLAAYLASKTLVVSTYSSVFNVAPGLTDAQVIMLGPMLKFTGNEDVLKS